MSCEESRGMGKKSTLAVLSKINKFARNKMLRKTFQNHFLGLQETVYAVGFGVGTTLMGALFHALGTQLSLLVYSISTAALLVFLLLYTNILDNDRDYKKLAQDDDNE